MKKLVVACTLLLAGCFNFGGGRDQRVVVHYVLEDATPASAQVAVADPRTLLVSDTLTAGYYDSDTLVYSHAPGTLAKYRYARWSERPGKRFADLLRARLAAQSGFAAVAAGGQIHGELLLDTRLGAFYHDASREPGNARVELRAELIDLRQRRLLARKTFIVTAPLATYDAASAAHAFDQATGHALDAVVAWLATARQTAPTDAAALPPR